MPIEDVVDWKEVVQRYLTVQGLDGGSAKENKGEDMDGTEGGTANSEGGENAS